MKATEILQEAVEKQKVDSVVDAYVRKFEKNDNSAIDERLQEAAAINRDFYSLVTDFYLEAWGHMFHFGVRKKGQDFESSLVEHEMWLADKLDLKEVEKCLDIGCGVGGPMINMAKKAGVQISGINNNDYQIKKGRQFLKKEGLDASCTFVECDWMDIPLSSDSYDKAYSIEALCHAADHRTDVFREIHRLLKPGALFGGYDWVLTGDYDALNPMHKKLKHEIEIGNGIANLNFAEDIVRSLEETGFEVLECSDRALSCDPETPWYLPLKGESASIKLIKMNPIGRVVMRNLIRALEFVRILPKGTLKVSKLLNIAGEALTKAGEENIFTPMCFFLARKV